MIAGRRLSRGEGVHMPFVQVSVRQTEYPSKNELQIQSNATLSSCLLQQQNSNISGSISTLCCISVCGFISHVERRGGSERDAVYSMLGGEMGL